MEKIIISESQKQILSKYAEDAKPNESCALLFGKYDNSINTVQEIFLTKNIEESPVNFTISNDELIKGYSIAEEEKLDMVGIFHSHPSSDAVPSETDRKFMQSNPVVWVIYSGTTKEFRAYKLDLELLEIQVES